MNITVTCSPSALGYFIRNTGLLNRVKAIINVSDNIDQTCKLANSGKPSFWFPIHEAHSWGYAPFYGAAKIVDEYQDVIIHCRLGINRSKCIAYAILKAEGLTEEETSAQISKNGSNYTTFLFEKNMNSGRIPKDIISFLQARKQYPTHSLSKLLNVSKKLLQPNHFS